MSLVDLGIQIFLISKKFNKFDEIESGTSVSLGFDYNFNTFDRNLRDQFEKFTLSVGQVVNEKRIGLNQLVLHLIKDFQMLLVSLSIMLMKTLK